MAQEGSALRDHSDEQVAELAIGGDRAAFAELYRRYHAVVYGFAMSVVGNEADAEEVRQDSFIKAYRSIGQLAAPASFREWMLSLTRATALNYIRGRRRRPSVSLLEEHEELPAGLLDEDLEARDSSRLIRDAAAGLTPSLYKLFELHVRRGLNGIEIAGELATTANSVYVRLSRMRDALEDSVVAILLERRAADRCAVLAEALGAEAGRKMTPRRRRAIKKHADGCDVCGDAAARIRAMQAGAGKSAGQDGREP